MFGKSSPTLSLKVPEMSDPNLLVRLSAAAGVVEKMTGERPHAATISRWTTRGLQGVRLRTCYAGGIKRTTEAWIRAFFRDVTAAKAGERVDLPAEESPQSQSRDRAVRAAHAELEAAGM